MDKTIAFLTSGHSPFDDRIYYHFADTLKQFHPVIISSTIELSTFTNDIKLDCFDAINYPKNKKIESFQKKLVIHQPDIIICSEPLPIIAAKKYKKPTKKCNYTIRYNRMVPVEKNTEGLSLLKKIIKSLTLWLFNKYVSIYADAFIFGEYYKSIPYRRMFPFKKWEIIPYYPNLKYIHYSIPKEIKNEICLGYTGRISIEKGINNFFEVIKKIQVHNPKINIRLKIIGKFANDTDIANYKELTKKTYPINIELLDYIKFEEYTKALEDIDLLFDLRKVDYENNRCLPIKLFYYAACGKPVIYSNLKSIRKEINISSFGYLVNPKDFEKIAQHIQHYINSPALYIQHSLNARKFSESHYNWDVIAIKLTNFVELLVENADKKCSYKIF